MKNLIFFLTLVFVSTLVGCSRPTTGVCSHCPVWWIDPVCLFGGNVPDPIQPKVQAPPPVETDLIPGQENAVLQK